MKIIFLDFDGVLINRRSFLDPAVKIAGKAAGADPNCIDALNRITEATGAHIVVSSTHRIGGLMHVREQLHNWGAKAPVIDITPRLHTHKGEITIAQPRGLEIGEWLGSYDREDIESFVILDDDADMVHLKDRLIQTAFEFGLTMSHAERAIAMLSEVAA